VPEPPIASADPYAAQAPVAAPPAQPPAEPKPLAFALVARNNKLVSGPAVIKVQKGDEVTITITSDKADKLHLHGYDLHADLAPGKTATLKFKANLTGRFTYELHRADVELGAVEVFPR
jgi:plastocyanin